MTERLRDQIAQLRVITPRLHAVTDDAARIVQMVETFLNEECKLGLTAHFDFDSFDHGDGSDSCTRFEYGRIDGQFRLIVSEISTDPSGEETCISRTAWINCTRGVKLHTINFIPHLLAAIGRRVQSTITLTEQSAIKVNELLQDLGIAGKEEKK